jgi:hypothetical protein
MEKFRAVVTFDDFPSYDCTPEGYNGESKVKIIPSFKKYCPFDCLRYIVSNYMMSKENLNYTLYCHILMECAEKIGVSTEKYSKKGKLARLLLSYPIEYVKSSVRYKKLLTDYNKFSNILLNPRSIGSNKWKHYKGFNFKVKLVPGLRKSEFPEVQYIAVGYRDKGNCRKQFIDGSPSWQEVSMDVNFQENQKKESVRVNSLVDLYLKDGKTKWLRQRQLYMAYKRRREERDFDLL